MDSFYEVHLIIDGALIETNQFANTMRGISAKATWNLMVSAESRQSPAMWEVFELFHQHPPVGGCECFQFELDHAPKYVYNG